jgi:hypothetical protein
MALPVTLATDHAALINSGDARLAAHKKLCYEFYRIVLRGRCMDQAEKYMHEDYIQHNPNADTGIKGFKGSSPSWAANCRFSTPWWTWSGSWPKATW